MKVTSHLDPFNGVCIPYGALHLPEEEANKGGSLKVATYKENQYIQACRGDKCQDQASKLST